MGVITDISRLEQQFRDTSNNIGRIVEIFKSHDSLAVETLGRSFFADFDEQLQYRNIQEMRKQISSFNIESLNESEFIKTKFNERVPHVESYEHTIRADIEKLNLQEYEIMVVLEFMWGFSHNALSLWMQRLLAQEESSKAE